MSREVFEDYISEISHQYTYDTYDLLRFNCNNFTETASVFLTGNSIPSWISGLPQEVLNTPFGRMIEPMISQWTNRMKHSSMVSHGLDPSNFPATQASMTQSFFSNPSTSTASSSTPTTDLSLQVKPHKTEVTMSADSSASLSAHTQRRFLLADQRPSSFSTIFKQLSLGQHTTEVVGALEKFFASKQPVLPDTVLDALINHTNTCDIGHAFAPLFTLRLLVLDPTVNRQFSSDARAISLIHRYLSSDSTPLQPRAMALLLAANLFSHKSGEDLILESHHTTEWLAPELIEVSDQRRTPAAGLLYNVALALSSLPKSTIEEKHEDKFWQAVTLIAEVLSETVKSLSTGPALAATEEEFLWRICSALFFFIESDASAKELATQLEIPSLLKLIQGRTAGAKLAPLLQDTLKML